MADSHRKNFANLKNDGQGEHATLWTAINGKRKASQWVIMHKIGGKVAFKSNLSGLYINVRNDGADNVELWSCRNGDYERTTEIIGLLTKEQQ